MKELSKSHPVQVYRSGYADSGFVFYFVRCRDRKTLADYVAKLPGGEQFEKDGEPFGFSYTGSIAVLPGVIPEADGTDLWVAYMVVVGGGVIDHGVTITAEDERRHWYHEIGHVVENFVEAHSTAVDKHLHDDWKGARYEGTVEAAAYCNEFLCGSLDAFYASSDAGAKSGLPFVMPWCEEAK